MDDGSGGGGVDDEGGMDVDGKQPVSFFSSSSFSFGELFCFPTTISSPNRLLFFLLLFVFSCWARKNSKTMVLKQGTVL